MIRRSLATLLLMLSTTLVSPLFAAVQTEVDTPNKMNGGEWIDTDGNRINCHGGNIIKTDSLYYWYGEHRPGFDADYQKGVICYSSKDLKSWKNEGIVVPLFVYK